MKTWISVMGLLLICSPTFAAPKKGPRTQIGGGDVPYPFVDLNQRVELADGETYLLVGRIRVKDDSVFFEPDFDKHPWLSNKRRLVDPLYPVRFVQEQVRNEYFSLQGQRVKIVVEANVEVEQVVIRRFAPRIYIKALKTPEKFEE